MSIVLVLVAVRFCLWTMMAELCFSVDDYIRTICLISAIKQQTPQANTTAAGTVAAGQQRLRAPTTPASAAPSRSGLFCLLRVVLVLVAVRFGLWTMMAELSFSFDDFIRTISLLSAIQQQTPQANTTAAGTVAGGQQRLRAPTTPAGAAPCR